ncbi:MAG TPA: biotin carboxylase N-terminal domain-containing protein [Candidatus Eisenbacteria bacterium]|nr:biotin carboxylase N-terminal domain-containing protein [Candidatus Eisenbacteria bacterium]
MFRSVLIANRGEIACRIAATLRAMGVRSVAVYSDADRDARHVRVADAAVALGPAEARASYLNVAALIAAARQSGAEAVHPGYGFLSENAEFAAAVEAAGLAFVGPTAEQIRAMGDKRAARERARAAGGPIVPGAEGADAAALERAARPLGFPLIVKAALGGGGKGMRVVHDRAQLDEALDSAARVAASAFGDASVYVERRIERARHVEVQVLGDGAGNAIHLLERECSLQRRHQKVMEECPSPVVGPELRARMTDAALALARAVRYRGAGTLEFLLAEDESFYFLEMNTRLQVEHPVTEWVTGFDLVRLQLEVAATARLPLAQEAVAMRGHAIEARVYAEDAARAFLPQAGVAARVRWPRAPFVRVDDGLMSGDAVPVHYDPILAKLIAWGPNRGLALARLTAALDGSLVHGVISNLPFLRALARAPEVRRAAFDTEWIEREFLAGFAALAQAPAPEQALAAASIAELLGLAREESGDGAARAGAAPTPFDALGAWRQPGLA